MMPLPPRPPVPERPFEGQTDYGTQHRLKNPVGAFLAVALIVLVVAVVAALT